MIQPPRRKRQVWAPLASWHARERVTGGDRRHAGLAKLTMMLALALVAAPLSSCGLLGSGDGTQEGSEYEPGGPLDASTTITYYVRPKAGQVKTDGQTILVSTDLQPVTIDRIEPIGLTDNLQVLGVLAAGRKRDTGSIQISDGYPPHDPALGPLKDAVGAVVPGPRVGLELLMGVKVNDDQFAARTGIRVYYHRKDQRWRQDIPNGFAYCGTLAQRECEDAYRAHAEQHPLDLEDCPPLAVCD